MALVLLQGGPAAAEPPVQLELWPEPPESAALPLVQDAARLLLFGALPRVALATGASLPVGAAELHLRPTPRLTLVPQP